MTGASQMDDARWEHMEENLNLLFAQITDMGTTQQHPRQQQRAAADQVRHAQHLSMASVVSEMGDSEVFVELTHWDDDEMFDDRSLSEVIWDREASNELFDARSAQAVIWDEESLSERVAYSVFEEMPLKDNVAALLEQAMFSTTMEAKDGSKMVFAEVLLENDATTLVEQITFVAPIASKGATHEVIWDEEPQQFGGEMGAAGNGSNTKFLSLQVGERDDRSGNTKLYSDFTAAKMQVNPFNDDSSLIHIKLEQSLSSVQAFVAEHMNSKDLDMDWSKEAVGLNGFRDVGCNDLRDVAVNSLRMFFKTAVQMLSSEGYTEDDVVNAIVDSALCYQFDGPINKITEHARTLLQSGDHQVDYSHTENAETVLHMLGLYFVCNASSLLNQCCPFFTLGDALWCILMCDLDISIARAAFAYMSGYGNGQSEGHAIRQRDLCEDRENASDLSEDYGCSSATESPTHFVVEMEKDSSGTMAKRVGFAAQTILRFTQARSVAAIRKLEVAMYVSTINNKLMQSVITRPWDPGIITATAWGQAVFRGGGNVMTQERPNNVFHQPKAQVEASHIEGAASTSGTWNERNRNRASPFSSDLLREERFRRARPKSRHHI